MRQGKVFHKNKFAGIVFQDDEGYGFVYDGEYLKSDKPEAISYLLPLQTEPFRAKTLLPFFDGLIPEGWLLSIAEKNWKLDSRDRMGLLLSVCRDCIGAAHIEPIKEKK